MLIVPRQNPPTEAADRTRISWEESPCPQCAGRAWTPLIEAQDTEAGDAGLWFAVVQCDSCGTCFTNPRPDPGSIGQFYANSDEPNQKHHQPRMKFRWNPFHWPQSKHIEYRPVPWHGSGRLLDLDCGNGEYLTLMRQRGWNVTGIDFSAQRVERIRTELGLTAFVGTLPHLELEPESFDAITMWHSLERSHEPMTLLREARHLLAPGGKLVIEVPNIDSLPFRWFGRHWHGLRLPRHLTHFTPMSLQQMLHRCGFAIEPIRGVRHPEWFRTSANQICLKPNPLPWMRAMQYRIPSFAASWWCEYMGQSDCMLAVAYR